MSLAALDLFAGTGWGVACKRLGIEEHGVEIMPEAIATREANGMQTIYGDVWEGLEGDVHVPGYDLLIASPPCQTFSMAGNGAGRRALDEVVGLIRSGLFVHPHELREFGERHDPRTALVLTPLAHVARDTPRLVVFEQVPTVLPVWEACAEVMRGWGYSVITGILNAEQYGVPQTRRRAILVARWDGEARMPTPTHSRYYPRDPKRLDPGVLPWVSMADALGWDAEGYAERHRGAGMLERHGARAGRPLDEPSLTVTGNASGTTPGGFRVMRSNYGTGGDASARGEREANEPAPTVTSKVDRNLWLIANDRLSHAARRHIDTPAPTITAGHDSGNRMWQHERPATTVAGDPRIAAAGHHVRQMNNATRVTVAEAARLQSYPDDFIWEGIVMPDGKPMSKSKAYLQIGNAVPPLLAEAILRTLLD